MNQFGAYTPNPSSIGSHTQGDYSPALINAGQVPDNWGQLLRFRACRNYSE